MGLTARASAMPAYGWLFALTDGSVNVGAGLLNTFANFKDLSARGVFDAFVRALPAEWNVNEDTAEGGMLSGPLPLGGSRPPPARPGMLWIGRTVRLMHPSRLSPVRSW